MSSGNWVVRLQPWALLHPVLRQAVWDEIIAISGVASITDLEVVSPQTLEAWMLPNDQSLVTRRKRVKDAPSP